MTFDALARGWAKSLGVDRKQFNMFFDRMMDGFAYQKVIVDKDGKPVDYVFLEVNSAFEDLTGFKKEKIVGKKVTEVLKGIESDPADWIGIFGRVALTGEPVQFVSFARSLGRWYRISAYCPEKGYFVSLFEDIDEQKKIEEELRLSEERFFKAFQASPEAMTIQTANDSRFTYVNESFLRLFEYSSDEVIGRTSAELNLYVYPERREQIIRKLEDQGSLKHFENVWRTKSRRIVPLLISVEVIVLNGQKHYLSVLSDVSELKKAEEALRVSEENYRHLLQYAPTAIYEIDYRNQRFKSVNEAVSVLSGYSREELLAMNPADLLDAESRARFQDRIRRGLAGEKIEENVEYKVRIKDGRELWVVLNVRLIGKDGKFDSALVVGHDITERKKAEKSLKASEERFRSTLDNMMEGGQIIGFDWRYIYINDAAERHNRRPKEELLGKRFMDMWPGIESTHVFEVIRRCMNERICQSLENEFTFPDGTVGWFDLRIEPVSEGIFILSIDITERKKAEQELWKAKNDWERTFDSVPDFVAMLDDNYKIVRANRAMARRLGVTPEKAVGMTCYECVHGTTCPLDNCPHAQLLKDGKEHMAEIHEPRLGGDFIVSDTPLLDEKGKLVGSVHVARNITERKKAEITLRESEESLKRSQEIAHLGSWELDLKENRLTWSDEVYRIFGLKPLEFGATYEAFLSYVHPDDRAAVDAAYSGSLREGKDGYEIEHRVVRKDSGEVRVVHEKCTHVRDDSGQIVKSLGMVHDITGLKKAEEALHKSEEQFRAFVTTSSDVVYRMSPDWTEMRQLRGKDFIPDTNEPSKTWLDRYIHPDDQQRVMAVIKQAIDAKSVFELEHRVIRVDGTLGWTFSRAIPILDKDGKIIEWLGTAKDVTERKKAIEAIQESEVLKVTSSYARTLIEASPDPLVTINAEGKITDVNKATEDVTGYARERLIGSDFSDYFTKPEEARKGYQQVFSEGFVKDYPLAIRHESGKITDVLYNAAIYRNEQGQIQGIFAAARDITERKKAEELARESERKLKDAERLAAIGATAGMVGHDIRNPLQAIIGELYLAKSELDGVASEEVRKNLAESIVNIENEVDYINKIVQDLQDFAKPLKPVAKATNIRGIVEEILTKNHLPENVKVSRRISERANQFVSDPDMLKRIIANLISNAVQAMPKGGKLSVRASVKAGDLFLSVEDTGVGIPEEARSKLFTPLFTTKSKGQGFGLSVVKRMAEALGGTVTFESEVGEGTKFIVRLPLEK